MRKNIILLSGLFIIIIIVSVVFFFTEFNNILSVKPPIEKITPVPTKSIDCKIGGCSGQICSDGEDVITTCEYKEEYGCYNNAICELQKDGKCGWTQTKELLECLQKAK